MDNSKGMEIKGYRNDKLAMAAQLELLRELYEESHPETRHGTSGRGRRKPQPKTPRFTLVAAKSLGVGERTVYSLLQIARLPETTKRKAAVLPTLRQRNRFLMQAIGL